MKEFNRWIFNQVFSLPFLSLSFLSPSELTNFLSRSPFFQQSKNSVIVGGGHSFYFRAFFRCFLDAEDEHIAKKYIMKNGAVVAFDLVCVCLCVCVCFMCSSFFVFSRH